ALEQLRKRVLSVSRGIEEHFGYGMPAFRYNGHPLLYMGAAKNHCALYGSVPAGFRERLKDFTVSNGAIQFSPGKPIPAALLRDIVKAKVAEIELQWPVKPKQSSVRKAATKK
nr:DUF1801 domain-containing protein [Flavobacteriales bacterium]